MSQGLPTLIVSICLYTTWQHKNQKYLVCASYLHVHIWPPIHCGDSYCKMRNNSTNRSNEFKQFNDSRVQQIVSLSVFFKRGNHWIKQLAFDNVAIVEFILQANYSPQEAKWIWKKNSIIYLNEESESSLKRVNSTWMYT